MNAADWVIKALETETELCMVPPFKQNSIYWRGTTMSLPRVVCGEKNGWDGDILDVPIRSCGTKRCGNGRHYHWGGRPEAQAQKAVPRNHSGEKNPNAKLDLEKAREIRAMVAAAPEWTPPEGLEHFRRPRAAIVSYHNAMTRRELAAKYGVTLKTIERVVSGRIWKEPETYGEPTEGDEF